MHKFTLAREYKNYNEDRKVFECVYDLTCIAILAICNEFRIYPHARALPGQAEKRNRNIIYLYYIVRAVTNTGPRALEINRFSFSLGPFFPNL